MRKGLLTATCLLSFATRSFAATPPEGPTPERPAAIAVTTPLVPEAERRWLALAVFTEGALGFQDDGFYNHLVGPRLDYHAGDRLTLGVALSYANLKGPNGRVSNVLPAALLEWRAPLGQDIALPIRFFSGYLPLNGPWLKLALGLSRRLGDRTTLTFEALAPALWIVRDSTVASMDASLELAVEL
jgi:hypothetical protein